MKKLITFLIIAYLSFTINSTLATEDERIIENENTLKVGVLLPLSGKFQDTGKSFLKAIQLALYDISNKNIKIYPKDSKANSLDTYLSAKEFEEEGIKRTRNALEKSDLVLVVFDTSQPLDENDDLLMNELGDKPRCILFNKSDLKQKLENEKDVHLNMCKSCQARFS